MLQIVLILLVLSAISCEEVPKSSNVSTVAESSARSLLSDLGDIAGKSVVKPPRKPDGRKSGASQSGKSEKSGQPVFMGPMNGVVNTLNDVVKGSLSIISSGDKRFGETAEELINATRVASKVIGSVSRVDDMLAYYHRLPLEAPDDYIRPKYFSTDCAFRVACEIGSWFLRPNSPQPIKDLVKQNRLIHDLQNKYTRAVTYGFLFGDCSRYYCVFLEFSGGPIKFAGAVTEITNRLLNPDLYQ